MELAQVYRSNGDYRKAIGEYIKLGPGIINNSDFVKNSEIVFHKNDIHVESR